MTLRRKTFLAVFAAGLAGVMPSQALADCRCRAEGRHFVQGERICLKTPVGSYLAECGKVLNNSAWKKIADECPQAEGDLQGSHALSEAVNPGKSYRVR